MPGIETRLPTDQELRDDAAERVAEHSREFAADLQRMMDLIPGWPHARD